MKQNMLSDQSSMYLKKNILSPVGWEPLNQNALNNILKNSMPVLISIGDSFSRFSELMDKEVYEDEEIAKFLNLNFNCIKVDRHEFPELHHYFQRASHIFNNPIYNPDIPLTAFLTNELKTVFVGGLYPLHRQEESPSFLEVLNEIKKVIEQSNESFQLNTNEVLDILLRPANLKDKINYQGHFPVPEIILNALKNFRDVQNGGYGSAPKFPTFTFYEWSIEQILEGMIQNENAEFIVKSLEKILMSGVVDHAKGGVFDYAVDEKWTIPNFSKKLAHQSSYLKVLAKFSLLYPSPIVYDTIIDTIKYLQDEMLLLDDEIKQNSYFFSKQDSVSENTEGLFYTFTLEEFQDAINRFDNENETLAKNYVEIEKWFNLNSKGNFQNKLNVISLNNELKDVFYQNGNWELVRLVKKAIEKERKLRIPPKTDSIGIASWNFQLLSSLVDVIQYVKIDVIKNMASELINKSLQGIFDTFIVNSEKGLMLKHATTNNQSILYFEDFVCFAELQLRLFEISANAIFKQNFLELMPVIRNEFVRPDRILSVRISSEILPQHFEIEADFQDKETKSPLATFIILTKKEVALTGNLNSLEAISESAERLKQITLSNPITAGEALRALCYPDEVYRKILVPSSWVKKQEFQNLLQYFLHRFVIDYHEVENEWSISSKDEVELKGQTISEFISTLTPNKG